MALDMNFILKVYYFIDNLRSNKEPKLVNIFHYWSQDFFTPNSWLKASLIKGPLTSNLTFSELNIATLAPSQKGTSFGDGLLSPPIGHVSLPMANHSLIPSLDNCGFRPTLIESFFLFGQILLLL
jgi:hypothetical protein